MNWRLAFAKDNPRADRATCTACGDSFPLDADHFYRHSRGGFQSRCKRCDNGERSKTRAPSSKGIPREAKPRRGRACRRCEGQPWRREDQNGKPLPPGVKCLGGCGGEYAPEPAKSAVECGARGPGPVFPTGGGFRL